ncbi:MAG: Pvc16 family protein [Anaerolineae bacterium]
MFQHLHDVLRALCREAPVMATEDPWGVRLKDADISFATPDKDFRVNKPTLNILLSEVKENLPLRDALPVTRKLGEAYIRQRAPLRVDCDYMITAWSNRPGEERAAQEQSLLGQAMLWLSRFPIVPERALKDEWGRTQPFPPPTMLARMDGSRNSAGEFWSALGIPPRPYFNLVLTIAMDLDATNDGPLVLTTHTGSQPDPVDMQDNWMAIGGTVVDPLGRGIADAMVDIIDTVPVTDPTGKTYTESRIRKRTTTDKDGRFRMSRVPRNFPDLKLRKDPTQPTPEPDPWDPALPANQWTFRVAAQGFATTTVTKTLPAMPGDLTIELSPL